MKVTIPLSVLLVFLGLTGGSWHLWSLDVPALIPAGSFVVAFALVLGLVGVGHSLFSKRQLPTLNNVGDVHVWVLGLVLIFFSGWLCRPYNLFQGPSIRGPLALATIIAAVLPISAWRRLLLVSPLIASALFAYSFFAESQGRLLFADDHAMFFFRLQLLKENFPSIPFWSPLWNAGIDARDFFATGALNAFLLASPLVYAFPLEKVYNIIIVAFLFGLVPLSSYWGARLFGGDRTTRSVTALLAMCSSLFWYRWGLKYGTVGFIISTSLIPLVSAFFLRFISTPALRWGEIAAFAATTTLMLLWSPSGIALLPLALIALPRVPLILRSRRHIATILIIVALNVPWMTMMWKVSNVGKFLDAGSKREVVATQANASAGAPAATEEKVFRHRAGGLNLKKSLKQWQETAVSTSPLVVVLVIPAILALPRGQRLTFGLLSLWLGFLGTIGVSLKPQLELDRMLVIASVLASYPLALAIVKLLLERSSHRWHRVSAAVVGGFVLVAPIATHNVLRNRAYDKYVFANEDVDTLTQTIATHAQGGRALFTGCVLHELSGGHLAPLAFWSKTPLIATSYAHNIWHYEQPIPKSYLDGGDEGIRRFFDTMNVTVVTAHEKQWREYFQGRPQEYAEIARLKNFIVFRRLNITPSFVLEGSATDLTQDSHSVQLTPTTDRVVLKFKFFPFLTSSGCRVAPQEVSPELSLVELSGCAPGKRVSLQSVSPLERLQM